MQDALNLFYYLFNKTITWVFNAQLFTGVTIGWVLISIIVMGILIKNLLSIPRASPFVSSSRSHYREYSTTDSSGTIRYVYRERQGR